MISSKVDAASALMNKVAVPMWRAWGSRTSSLLVVVILGMVQWRVGTDALVGNRLVEPRCRQRSANLMSAPAAIASRMQRPGSAGSFGVSP